MNRAPANFPILLNRFNDVKNALIPIKMIDVIAPADSSPIPLNLQKSNMS